jgi:hypothetical protein
MKVLHVENQSTRKAFLMGAFLIVLVNCLPAQGQFLGLEGAVGFTNVITQPNIQKNDQRMGIAGGLTYEYRIKNHFSVGLGLNYNQRGYFVNSNYAEPSGNMTNDPVELDFNFRYLSLPMKVGYRVGTKAMGFLNLGICPSMLLEAKWKVPAFDSHGNVNGTAYVNETDKVNKYDFAGFIEAGGGYLLKERYFVFSSLSYQQSFTSLSNPNYFASQTIRHYGVMLALGFKYRLTNG